MYLRFLVLASVIACPFAVIEWLRTPTCLFVVVAFARTPSSRLGKLSTHEIFHIFESLAIH